jgi:hypothetical protein
MSRVSRQLVFVALTERVRRFARRFRRWRPRPQRPDAGVREPRRPKPTLPAGAIALAEPRTQTLRWMRLRGIIRRRAE